MTENTLAGRRVLVPGGTGGVGEGIVRAFLAAGADVVVPTRTPERGAELRAALGELGHTPLLHLPTHDYTSFDGAATLAATMVAMRGGIDDVIVPVGGWWAGGPLHQITDADWQHAFVEVVTAHMGLARAVLPLMSGSGAYTIVIGQSAELPVPGSGLVSMEQATRLMLQRVLAAENPDKRILALELGPVSTRLTRGEPGWVTSDQVGAVALAATTNPATTSRTLRLASAADADTLLTPQV